MCTCLVVSHWLKEALKNKQLSYLATARQEGAYRAREVILDHHILYSLCPTLQTHTQIRSPFLPSPASDLSGQFCLPGLWPPVFQLKPRSSLEFSSWIPQPGQQLHVTKEPGSFQRTGREMQGPSWGRGQEEEESMGHKQGRNWASDTCTRERPMAGDWSPETCCQEEMNPSRLTNHSNSLLSQPSPPEPNPVLISSPQNMGQAHFPARLYCPLSAADISGFD